MKKRYVATGQTYQHRETFAECAWHWDAERRAWIEDNGSEEQELCIQVIKDLPGVRVAIECEDCHQAPDSCICGSDEDDIIEDDEDDWTARPGVSRAIRP